MNEKLKATTLNITDATTWEDVLPELIALLVEPTAEAHTTAMTELHRMAQLADRSDVLERTARVDASIAKQLSQSMSINARLQARVKVLEAALRKIATDEGSYLYREIEEIARAALDKDTGK
jgi:hypothetical protein